MKKKFLKNKRVLITGGAGLLGISLTKTFFITGSKSFFVHILIGDLQRNYQNILKNMILII